MPTRIDKVKARRKKTIKKIRFHQRQVQKYRRRKARQDKRLKELRARRHGAAKAVDFLLDHKNWQETPGHPNRAPWLDAWWRECKPEFVGQPWCGLAVWKAAKAAGKDIDKGVVYTPNIINLAKAKRGGFKAWHARSVAPQLGWVAVYGYPGGAVHTGMYAGNGYVAEGNTSPGSGGSQNNGGGLYLRKLSERRGWLIGWAEIDW
jgi:hypothetical protein